MPSKVTKGITGISSEIKKWTFLIETFMTEKFWFWMEHTNHKQPLITTLFFGNRQTIWLQTMLASVPLKMGFYLVIFLKVIQRKLITLCWPITNGNYTNTITMQVCVDNRREKMIELLGSTQHVTWD